MVQSIIQNGEHLQKSMISLTETFLSLTCWYINQSYGSTMLFTLVTYFSYDDRFKGYGWDKVSHSYEIHHAGYQFSVYPNDFLIHIYHEKTPWHLEKKKSRVQRDLICLTPTAQVILALV